MSDDLDQLDHRGEAEELEQLQVAFPATPTFTRIGRVAVVGLALRLGLEVETVESLRNAVDEAVSSLQGHGRISIRATWTADELTVTFENPDTEVDDPTKLVAVLSDLVGVAAAGPHSVRLAMETPGPAL